MSGWRLRTGSLGLCLSISLCEPSIQAQTASEIAQKSFGSVVLLIMQDRQGQPVALGSGFFVKPGVVATNLHVVEGAAHGYAKGIASDAKLAVEGLLAVDDTHDLALLSVPGAVNFGSLPLQDDANPAVGDEVYAVGNPRGLEGTFSKRIVSSIRKIGSDTLLQITAPISPGSSGGPVLNARGNVVGIAAATFKGGQNLNFAIPVFYLSILLPRASAAPSSLQDRLAAPAGRSFLTELGSQHNEGVVAIQPDWSGPVNLEFRLQNRLDVPVRNIRLRFAFYDSEDEMISFAEDEYEKESLLPPSPQSLGYLPAGFTVLRNCSLASPRIRDLTRKVDIQVLDYEIVRISGQAVVSAQKPDYALQEQWDNVRQYYRTRSFSLFGALAELQKMGADDSEVWFYFGEAWTWEKEYERAISAYSQALRRKPDYAEAYDGRGVAYEMIRRYPEAINDYTEAIRTKPDYADAYQDRGDARKKSGDKRGSQEDYRKAKSLHHR